MNNVEKFKKIRKIILIVNIALTVIFIMIFAMVIYQ